MNNTQRFLIFSLLLVTITSCAKIYYSRDAFTLANQHKTIAIMPPTISIEARKKLDGDALIEQQKTESINFQREMYAWMLKRNRQGRITQEIQDVETTNILLARAGYPDSPLTKREICDILGVDGIMTSNFGLSKPVSEGGAVALYLLAGAFAATNEVRVNISITDSPNAKVIWNYDHKVSSSLGSSPSRIVDDIMRRSSRKMPYFRR